MLIEFSIQNFRQFYDKAVFSMQKGLKRDQLDTIIFSRADKEYALLPSKVIYGVNASGKTSLILSIKLLKKMILKGDIESDETLYNLLPLCHFLHEDSSFFDPFRIHIAFIDNETRFDYEVGIVNIEKKDKPNCEVEYESLSIDKINVFKRDNTGVIFNKEHYNRIKGYFNNASIDYLLASEEMYHNNINGTSIFTSWFQLNSDLIIRIKEWFSQKLIVIENLDSIKFDISSYKSEEEKKNVAFYNQLILSLVKQADFGPQNIKLEIDKTSGETLLMSTYQIHNSNHSFNSVAVRSEITESLGTLKLIKFLAPFINALINGSVLFIDELDSSIHPEVIAGIIKVFSNPDVNDLGAQLIFSTHNPVLLNKNLFRRDEIVFVEKDEETFKSKIFTLDDINIRGDESYLKNYLEGKYINFSDIDFSCIMKELKDEDGKD